MKTGGSMASSNTGGKGLANLPGRLLGSLFGVVMNALDLVLEPLQRLIGVKRMPYFFVLPNLLIFGVFILFPMLLNFYYAFTGGTALYPQDRPYVGLQNFDALTSCTNYLDPNTCVEDRFWRALHNSVVFVSVQVIAMVLFSLITAMVLNRNIRWRGFFRSVYFYPVLLSPVVVALIWKWILQRDGLLNAILLALGGERQLFLLNGNLAMASVIFISVWAHLGFYTLILLAGLQSIPKELYDAGSIDGANAWQSFRAITMPLLMPTMLVVLVLALIRAVQMFDEVFAFTGGGPGTSTLLIIQYIYNTGFSSQIQRFGLAAAASVLVGIALLIFTLIQLRLGRNADAT